jgi:hypothetical protein
MWEWPPLGSANEAGRQPQSQQRITSCRAGQSRGRHFRLANGCKKKFTPYLRKHWTSEKYLVLIVPPPQPSHPWGNRCRGGWRGSPTAIGSGALISGGTFMHAKSAASDRHLAVSVVRGGGAALRAGCRGDTSPPAGCCMGTYASIWELIENSGLNAESLPAMRWAVIKCSRMGTS